MIQCHILAEQMVHVRDVLTLLTEHGLKAKHVKGAWACQRINVCSLDIENYCIHAQEHKTCVVMDWPQPENCTDIRGFQGLTTYYQKCMNATLTLQRHCTRMGPIPKQNGTLGSNLQCLARSGTLHSPVTDHASMLSTPSKWDSAIL